MEKFLTDFIEKRKTELASLEARVQESKDADEVRKLGEDVKSVRQEIADAEAQLAELRKKPAPVLDPLKSYGLAGGKAPEERKEGRASMEYRKAFMDYVRTGKMSDVLEFRNNDQTESTDLGCLIPLTVVQEIITGVGKVYGQLYSVVKKTNIKGGVKYPIGAFSATFNRIGENGAPTDRQKGGAITGYVEFSYKIGEVRLARTLLESVLEVEVFEKELAKTIVKAYVKAMDQEILVGGDSTLFPTTYQNQCVGILTEAKASPSRIPASNIIEFTANDMADWKKWQSKLFAKIPLGMRGEAPQFVMTPNTYEANIKTLADDNNRPVAYETFNPVDGAEKATFKGREVLFIEEGLGIVNFDDGSNGDIFGMYWVPERAYAINTNLDFIVRRYFDEEKNQYVDKGIVINDGKVIDGSYIYLLKKKTS